MTVQTLPEHVKARPIRSALVAVVLLVIVIELLAALTHLESGFVFTVRQAALGSALILIVVGGVIDLLITRLQPPPAADDQSTASARRRGLKGLVIGADARASTSKLQATLWTVAILYALTFLLLLGRTLLAPRSCGQSNLPACVPIDVSAFKDVFATIITQHLKPEYIALLGLPLAGAVAAKAITSGKVATGEINKPAGEKAGAGVAAAEIVTDDKGNLDVLDFQYTAFNLLTLVYFFVQLFTDPKGGLPDIPATLLALSGVSVSAYTTKKALEKGVGPEITGTLPRRIVLTQDGALRITGSGFLSAGKGATTRNAVFLDGRQLAPAEWTVDTVEATIPTDAAVLKSEGFRARNGAGELAELVVQDDAGVASAPYAIEIDVPSNW